MQVEVQLLGPVRLSVDGEPVALTGVTQRVLLARLALAAGRVVPVADLIDTLWAEDPPDKAIGNLHSYVSRLRRETGASAVRREPGGYRLDVPGDAVDVTRVENIVASARGKEPGEAARLLGLALDTWRGPALADVADRPAFAPAIARLAQWHTQLRGDWLAARLDAGEAAEAIPELEALATAEPSSERPHLLLMRALHQTGRSAEALSVGRAYRDRIADEHGIDPGPALDALQQRILEADPGLVPLPRSVATSRPAALDRFVGRAAELAAVRGAIGGERVVTVVGPGGAGKTRLVREALTGDEVFVELGDVTDPDDVPTAVAGTLGVRVAPLGGTQAVIDRLGSSPAVLVMDNCEHLLDAVRQLVERVVAACPAVRVLATSRQRLGCAGERVLRLGPLSDAEQVELFCDRAAMLRADFDDGPRSRELAGDVCRLVDGLPLGVELAARREAVFGLAQLRERLGAGLQVLDPLDGGDRSTAVSATVEWSYRLLDPAAQTLLDRLSVCRGGFGLEAVDHFSSDGERLLVDLVDASLVTSDVTAQPPRYRLLETVRQVCAGHLGEEERAAAREIHARWMSRYVSDLLRRQNDRDPSSAPALRQEVANIQGALTFLVGEMRWEEAAAMAGALAALSTDEPIPALTKLLGGLAPARSEGVTAGLLASAAGHAALISSRYDEAEQLLAVALDLLPETHPLRWSARLSRMANAMFAGRVDDVHRDARLLAAEPMAPAWAAARGPCCAALIDSYNGDTHAAMRWLDDYRELTDGPDPDGFVAFTRGELLAESDPEAALEWFAVSLSRSEALAHSYLRLIAGVGRVSVLIRTHRQVEAATSCRELIASLPRAGMSTQMWTLLRLAAELLADLGDAETAIRVLDAADRHPLAPAVLPPDVRRHEWIRARAQENAGPARSDVPRDTGAAAALVTHALDRLVPGASVGQGPGKGALAQSSHD